MNSAASLPTLMTTAQAMRLAIREAYRGATRVSPNPLVGCVILNAQGEFLQSGYHEFYGGPHAEVNALRGLTSEQLKDAHLIVTLEPCAHEGKTPSCAKTIAKLPIRKVTYGLVDPNPLVAGQGAAILQAAGIEAEIFQADEKTTNQEIHQELEEVCEIFLKNFRENKIFVALKMATSLDGQVALKSGESQWITGAESRQYVHYLRANYDAILVGRGTVKQDNPSLNIRHPEVQKENKVVVLDPEAELLANWDQLKLSQVHRPENVFWCVADSVKEKIPELVKNLQTVPALCFVRTTLEGEFDLPHLLDQLWPLGIRSIMIEGGAMTASRFIEKKAVDRLLLFQAPVILGAGGAISWTSALKISSMRDKILIDRVQRQVFGPDLFLTGRLNRQN